jgi:DNA-binding SARP family transcriptional activator/predicted ATPase/uncharacterized protein HemY
MAQLKVALLGSFRATRDGNPITRFETEPARALLAYLVVQAGTPLRREVLADLLWPEQPRSEALHALRQTLNRLRRAIGDQEAAPPFLHITRRTIQFNPDSDYWLDVDAFTRLVTTIHEHRHRRLEACRTCVQRLRQAADLYRGDLLSGFHLNSLPFQEWHMMEREHLHRQAMETFYHLATCHNQRGEYEQARHYARRQLKLEPWREEAHRQLMVALSLSGQRSAALAQYETCRRILSEELRVEPETETTVLYERMRDGDLHPGETPPHNLPAPLTRFVGRETELDHIAERLNDPDYRLLTLVGTGGVGKTRLALAAARQAVAHFPDGVWFIPLIDVAEGTNGELQDTLAMAIAGALGLTFSGQDNPKIQLLRILRAKESLLVLDNFEHLTFGIDFVLEILKGAPKIVALVTSRTRLDAQAEHIMQIAGLPVPPQDDDPAAASYSSIQLFVDRTRYALDRFTHDLAQVVQVCRFVEGLPLAIEMASAWVEHLPVADIVANLHQDSDFLSTTRRDIPARHRRWRAVFESSWQPLSETEQRTLAQLAIFRGDFDRTAALTVTETQLAELISLTNKSLLQRTAPDRYALHALLRRFAAEKLKEFPSLSGAYNRHSVYYLSLVGERAAALGGGEPQQAAAEVQAEIANVRQAWQWAVNQLDTDQDPMPHIVALASCTEGLTRYYTLEGPIQEGERVFRTAANQVRTVVQEDEALSSEHLATILQALSKLLAAQGHFLVAVGDHSTALTVLQEANTASERAAVTLPDDDVAEQAMLLVNLGTSYNRVGDHRLAAQYLEAGLALARQAHDAKVEITALNTLAQAACEQGGYETAQQYLDEVLVLARECGDRTCEASALSMLGSVAWRWGDIERADRCCQESLAICRDLGDRHKIPRLLNLLGILAILRESYSQAEQCYEEGLVMAREMGDRQAMADMLNNLGYINHHHTGNPEKAKRYYQESLSIGREIGHRHGVTSTLSNLGHLHVLLGEHEAAWKCLREALSESVAIGVVPLTLDALVGVARLRAEVGKYAPAAELLGLVLNHPSVEVDSAKVAEAVLTRLHEALPADQLEAVMECGKATELNTVVAELLARDGLLSH